MTDGLSTRILSIDIMRGLTLFLMLFVNDLYMPGVPKWLGHTDAQYDGMGLADWVFPGFLFMVGMAIPFAYKLRKQKGDSDFKFIKHIIIRSLSLIIIGVLIVNISRLNTVMTGMPKNLWALSLYISIFLIWNDYNIANDYIKRKSFIFKTSGLVGLVILMYIFRAGTPEKPEWFIQSWWGILGLIGWSYLIAALLFMIIKNNILASFFIWIIFILLNAADLSGYTQALDGLKPIFGVIIGGNTPSIVLAGLFSAMILEKYKNDPGNLLKAYIAIGVICIISGFILRKWFIISKIIATPSWALICSGISFCLLGVLFYLVDYKGIKNWSSFFKETGGNSLTTYLAPDMIYYLIWSISLPVLLYKKSSVPMVVIAGSLLWAWVMVKWSSWLVKKGIKLKF